MNNAYFHSLVNHRHMKNQLSTLVGEDGSVYSTPETLDIVVYFYKKLFSFEPKPDIHLGRSFW